ncbi:hypothetical protein BDZ45DRAFT_587482 [Acephala macrosclerotiorum]|nr:hypothetical protein BDZ45DRAFT_587482 [Acephala macrosclerotiorum]
MLPNSIFSAISALSLVPFSSASPTRLNVRGSTPSASSVSTIYQFPNGTWLENLAIRENGGALLSDFTSPRLIYIDPFASDPGPSTVHTFPSPATGLVGIAELGTDIFYVATLDYSFATFSAVKGSGQLWCVDMSGYPESAPVTLVADLSNSTQPNGVTAVPGSTKILIADYVQGIVWRVDVKSGAVDIAANSSALAASGVNGIHAPGDGYIYFTNTGTSSYGRLPISSTGTETGAATVLFQNTAVSPDDFALYPSMSSTAAFLMDSGSNRVVYTPGNGNSFTTIANISGPTAAAFGRRSGDGNSLYVSSTGGDQDYAENPVPVGGRLTKIILA